MAAAIVIAFALVAFSLAGWLYLRSRRNPAPAATGASSATRGAGAAGVQGRSARAVADESRGSEKAWISRLTQGIPTVVRKAPDPDPAKPEPRGGVGLQGNLSQTPLHDLMQYLALGRKSGVLEIASGRRTGRMVMGEGKVQKAAYRGKEGIDAAFLMLDLADGDFEFYESARAEPVLQAPLEVVDIIMLWMARKPRKKQA